MIWQITPRCPGSKDPEDAVEDTSVVYPRNATQLVRQHRLDGEPFIVGEFVAHDSTPSLKFESWGSVQTQRFWPGPGSALSWQSGRQPADNPR